MPSLDGFDRPSNCVADHDRLQAERTKALVHSVFEQTRNVVPQNALSIEG
jgi:hypothetical protein